MDRNFVVLHDGNRIEVSAPNFKRAIQRALKTTKFIQINKCRMNKDTKYQEFRMTDGGVVVVEKI